MITFARFLAILAVVQVVCAGSQLPTWAGTNLIQAGAKTIVRDGVDQLTGNLYTYTYSPAFPSTPFTALGVIDFETTDLHEDLLKFKINIPNYTSSTSLQIRMNYPTDTPWRTFKVSYIAVSQTFDELRVDYFAVNNPANIGTGLGTRSYIGVFNLNISPVDITHKISIMPLLVGLVAQSVNGEHTVLWSTKLRTASSIDYNLTVKRTTSVTEFISYILVVDKTRAEKYFQIYMDQLYVGGENNTPTYDSPVYYNITNIHAGINSFSFELISFAFDKNSFALTTGGYYNFLNISIWSFRERFCSISFPYYEENSMMCYDVCPNGYVNATGTAKKYCETCAHYIPACQFCSYDGSLCSKCLGNWKVSNLTNTSCSCPDGFYVSTAFTAYVDTCRNCHSSCKTCNGPNQTQCQSCGLYRTLTGSSCTCDYGTKANGDCYGPCDDQGCELCPNVSICERCSSSFTLSGIRCICEEREFYDVINVVCESCHYSCLHCSGASSNQCNSCDRVTDKRYFNSTLGQCLCLSNYEEVNRTCQLKTQTSCTEIGFKLDPTTSQCKQICGDGILIELPCDDDNNNNEDGCSSTCQIQDGFTCADNSLAPSRRSYCSFVGQIKFTLVNTIKNIYSNRLNLTYDMSPRLSYVLKNYVNLTTNVAFEPNSYDIKTLEATYNLKTLQLDAYVQYGKDLQQNDITIVFKIPQTTQTFAVAVSRSSNNVAPSNNLAAFYYDAEMYKNIGASRIIGKIAYIGALIVTIFLIFFRKMIGLEFVCMLQLVYFAALLADYSYPLMGPIQQWEYINGYNQVNITLNGAVKQASGPFKILGYHNYFYANVNGMIYLSLSVYVIALTLFLLSMLAQKSTTRKLKQSSKFFALEIGFSFMIFSFNNIVVGIVIQVFEKLILQFDYIVDKFFVLFGLLIIIAHIVVFVIKCHDYSDSTFFYHKHKPYTHYFPLFLIARNLVVIISILLVPIIGPISTYIAMGFQVVYIIAVFVGRPYRKTLDYVRFAAVELTLLLYLVSRFIEATFVQAKQGNPMDKFFMYSSFIVLAGFLVSFALTLASFVYHFCKNKSKEAEIIPEENEYSPPIPPKNPYFNASDKSKQFMIYDLEDAAEAADEDNTGGGSQQNISNSEINQESRRKLRLKKSKQ